ncbi:hypothetical protein A2801_04135 [Candidatus Woesebacteria bacterium RIFCSPHIGHO2_01_FULL_41_10]|uniref:Winged helix-turn-helix domain-containing protein n=1 Tax=Candidatus Woesebacteria bacterium RIFCSPHIGHO2_01_FULL_41_10 TaxID=1802500 RepID=A0A1F7YLN6_9BACT|nr:MAG: hypothetical protein A2801_04135 [Candidatus Woesebacteria bacterium RIFCSPHIGHO2_01_FULL_41_10]
MPQTISIDAARNIMLSSLGLHFPPKKKATKQGVLKTICKMGQLQIDTINVVARSPYLVLWSRLGDYKPLWLDELLAEGKLFEYWSHAMCFLPIEDYPLYRRLMIDGKRGWKQTDTWMKENQKTVDHVLQYVRKQGETRSSDFKRTDGVKGAWWNWKVEKVALELLFNKGELMIAKRQNFHRIYDLRERVYPQWSDAFTASYEEIQKQLTLKALNALGIATPEWIADYFYTPKREISKTLEKLINEKLIIPLEVDDLGICFVLQNTYKHLDELTQIKPTVTTLLSPFDPLMNNRKRVKSLFNFDYQIECYTPAAKRKYGYFTLPILHRGKLVGRLDPKAHRKEGIFEIKAIYLEPGVKITDELVHNVGRAIQNCATWHQTPKVVVRKSNPKELRLLLTQT